MRVLLLVFLLAGCAAIPPDDEQAPPAELDAGRIVAVPDPAFNATAAYAREACAASCTFNDDAYHLAVSYMPHATSLDVVIAPSISSAPVEDLQAAKDAVLDWQRAIDEFAPPWLAQGLELHVHAVGLDIPTVDAVADPDIVVVLAYADRTGAVGSFAYGQGIRPLETVCGASLLAEPGMQIYRNDCLGIGYECLAVSTIASGDPDHVHNLVVHEVGHCLGNGHTGNAADFSARLVPYMDAMSYGSDPDRVSCVSNMNIELMARQFAPFFDQDISPVHRGDHMTFPPEDYRQGTCSPLEASR